MPATLDELLRQARHAFERQDLAAARNFLESARAAAPSDLLVLMTLSAVYRLGGQTDAEREAVHAALVVDPYFLPALLAKAACIERSGNHNGAATAYRNALTVAPPRERWPAALRSQLEHATILVDRHSREERTEVIRDECAAILREDAGGLTPYIAYRPGEPVNQWRELNHSSRWSVCHLWRNGAPVRENLARCPQTARTLETLRLPDIGGLCPNVMFSVLAPRTHIPPHHGETNARLVGHLPLIVPEKCSLRVGFEERRWVEGESLIFDDTIEHEARNDSDELRVVLIFDVWNPLLSVTEQALVRTIAAAAREFGCAP